MLVHGWPQHGWMWRRLLPSLSARYRVIRPDLRGAGASPAPRGAYAKEQLASDLLDLLDDLGLERVRLVGHDWGGMAGVLAALRAPWRFQRLVAMSIVHPWVRVPAPRPATLARGSYQGVLATPLLGARAAPAVARAVLLRGAAPGFAWRDDELEAYVAPYREPARGRAASALYRTFLTRELPALAAGRYAGRRLRVPTLLLTGEADPVVTPDRLRGAERHADDLRTGVIAGAGHFVAEESPEAVLDRLEGFL